MRSSEFGKHDGGGTRETKKEGEREIERQSKNMKGKVTSNEQHLERHKESLRGCSAPYA
jgi:hypothetical protein